MEMSSMSLSEKVQVFQLLEQLDRDYGDEEFDCNEAEEKHRATCRAFESRGQKRSLFTGQQVITNRAENSSPARQTSTEAVLRSSHVRGHDVVIEGTPVSGRGAKTGVRLARTGNGADASLIESSVVPDSTRAAPPSLQRSATHPLRRQLMPAEQSPSTSTAIRKRKRHSYSSDTAVSESDQIFRGLSFYYIPNDNVAPARRIRIQKAQQYGARWTRTVEGATHVVVDRQLAYEDIERILGAAASRVVIVNEAYPIDCISFRSVLNPSQHRYRVPGCPLLAQVSDNGRPGAGSPPQSSGESLQLKEPRRNPKRRSCSSENGTPPRNGQLPVEAREAREPGNVPLDVAEPLDPVPDHAPRQVDNEQGHSRERRSQDIATDELSDYISIVQKYRDLPLDEDDEESSSVKDGHQEVSGSDSDSSSSAATKRRSHGGPETVKKKRIEFEERFACFHGGTKDETAAATGPNSRTIEVLQSMCDYYTRVDDHWRTIAYRKAIATLKRQTVKITTEEEAYRLPNIGRRLAQKIEEIVQTDRLRRLEFARHDPADRALQTFLRIYDVGARRAAKWVAQGYRTLDDLRARPPPDLTPNQRLGIERYEDLNSRIPRAEVAALAAHVRRAAAEIEPRVELIVGGSYRRGADTSGDVDFIVTRPGTSSAAELAPFLEELVGRLTRSGFLVAALSTGRSSSSGRWSKWHGCCVLPLPLPQIGGASSRAVWRRIDFLLAPETEIGAALLYFTGNDLFNRSMRLLASRKGMRLNQHGLYKDAMRGAGRVKVTEGELVEGRDEKHIFEILGVRWREPWERWC